MKIVKRNGTIVNYNRDKIAIAINKANHEVSIENRISDEKIEEIILSNEVYGIDNYAFSNCSGLKTITIGDGVETIGSKAFFNCYSLTSIYYTGTKAEWNAIIKAEDWDQSIGTYVIYCKDGNIQGSGNT